MSTVNCPYCHAELNKMPQRKRKCPACGKPIYVKKTPTHREKQLFTEEQAIEIEAEWEQYHTHQKHLGILQAFGYTERDLQREQKTIFSKRTERQAVWRLLQKAEKQELHLGKKGHIFYQMALFAEEEGKDFLPFLQKARRYELLKYQDRKIQKVRILTGGACDECEKQADKVLTVKEALKTMPLPCKACTFTLTNNIPGFCRCSYISEQ